MMTSTLKRLGYFETYVLSVEAFPLLMVEESRSTIAGADPSLPTGYTKAPVALRFKEGDALDIEIDRETGVARGAAVEFTFGWDALTNANVLDAFKYPGAIAELTADLAYNATTINVDTTTGFDASGTLYLGREMITYTGKTATSFTGCTRGVLGHPWAYEYDSPTFKQCCDTVKAWRGRFVELHGHLCSPDGRMLDSDFLSGTYHRVIWRGYIDSSPKATKDGIAIRVMPLCRLPGQPVGHDQTGTVGNYGESIEAFRMMPILGMASQQASLYMPGLTDDAPVVFTSGTTQITSTGHFVYDAQAKIAAAVIGTVAGVNVVSCFLDLHAGEPVIHVEMQVINGTYVDGAEYRITVPPGGPYFLKEGIYDAQKGGNSRIHFRAPFRLDFPIGGYIPVRQTEGEGWQDLTIPSAGIGIFEAEGGSNSPAGREIMKWDDKITDADAICTISDLGGVVLLRISERTVNNTPRIHPVHGGELQILSGTTGTFAAVISTLMQSSGTTERGAYDTLGISMGYAIPQSFVEGAGFTDPAINQQEIAGVVEGRESAEGLLGGWLALHRRCLVQSTRTTSGDCLIRIVPTTVVNDSSPDVTISKAEVLLDGIDAPNAMAGPNEVKVDLSGIEEGATVTVQDLPRIQAEGLKTQSLKAPSLDITGASFKAATLIAYSDGQQVLTLPIAPWVDIQPGDTCKLTLEHPAIYDWQAGALAPASQFGRVVGWKMDLWTNHQTVAILLAGNTPPARNLCPTAKVLTNPTSTTVTISTLESAFFETGQKCKIYRRGEEDSYIDDLVIDAGGATTIEFTTSVPAWTNTTNTYLAFPDTDNTDATQDLFAFYNSTTKWA